MSYAVDPKTLLFTSLGKDEASDLLALCRRIVIEGKMEGNHPAFKAWWEVVRSPEANESATAMSTNAALNLVTAFPQRALLSLF